MMSSALYRQHWRRNRIRVSVICAGVLLWGFLVPVVYKSVLSTLTATVKTLPSAITHFGSGDIGSLTGTISVFFEHPFLVALMSTVVVGSSISAIASQRQRGTLELILARPISRLRFLSTTIAAVASMVAVALAALTIGVVLGAWLEGFAIVGGGTAMPDALPLGAMPLLWLNAFLLFGAFAAFALAASALNNRTGPALGITLGYLLAMYFAEILGGLWSPASWLQKYSLFDHFRAQDVLSGAGSVRADLAILTGALVLPLVVACARFPRRDIPAPG